MSRFVAKQGISDWVMLGLALLCIAQAPGDAKQATHGGGGFTAADGSVDGAATVVLMPRRQASLTSEIAGRISAVRFEFGQRFEAGDVLLELDDTVARAAVHAAEARLNWAVANHQRVEQLIAGHTMIRRAQAIVEAARTRHDAIESLHADSDASDVQLAEARRDLQAARSELEMVEAAQATDLAEAQRELALAQGQLASARRQLNACTILAPFDGRVAAVHVHEHEQVAAGDPVIDLVCDQPLLGRFLLPDRLFDRVSPGRAVRLRIAGFAQPIDATVSHIAALIEPASRTFEVRVLLGNDDARLRAGMTGQVAVEQFGDDR